MAYTPKNKFNVPLRKWNKWSSQAKAIFNRLYPLVKESPWIIGFTKDICPIRSAKIAWKIAWVAADAADNQL